MKKTIAYALFFFIFLGAGIGLFTPQQNQVAHAETADQQEKRLRKELERLEEEKRILQRSLDTQQVQSASIERDVDILTSQINKAALEIKQRNLIISSLSQDISIKNQTVAELTAKMNRSKEALSKLILEQSKIESVTLPEMILSGSQLSEFFVEFDSYTSIQQALDELFAEIREIKGETEKEKESLLAKQIREADLKAEIESQKKTIQVKEGEKKNLLAASRQAESSYQTVIAEKEQQAAAIRSALFRLRDTSGISFGEALKFAQNASKKTGVRAEFILAILKQESNLGQNVGTCNRIGDPAEKRWDAIMPGPLDNSWRDDQTIFLALMKRLGRDPVGTPLSCPMAGGWGGAMGPSQFIPTTWVSYEGRVTAAVGASADPWNPEHAFMATAIYVQDLGAAAGGYTAERTAALKYYAGSNWQKPQNAFYGNGVMQHASEFELTIKRLADLES